MEVDKYTTLVSEFETELAKLTVRFNLEKLAEGALPEDLAACTVSCLGRFHNRFILNAPFPKPQRVAMFRESADGMTSMFFRELEQRR